MILQLEDGQELFYEEKGNSSGKPLILLNGLSQSTLAWNLMLPGLLDYRVILVDLIFQGQSSKEGEVRNFDQHAHDIVALLNHLKAEKANVCGISYGSLVAQHLGVNHPERIISLILMASFAHKTLHFEIIEKSWWNSLDAGGFPLLVDVMLPTVLSENFLNRLPFPFSTFKDARLNAGVTATTLKKLMTATRDRKDYREDLKRIHCPVLLIHGAKDMLISEFMATEAALNIKECKMIIVPESGHTLNLEAPETCVKLIREFIN